MESALHFFILFLVGFINFCFGKYVGNREAIENLQSKYPKNR